MAAPGDRMDEPLRLLVTGELAFAAHLIDQFSGNERYELATERWRPGQTESSRPWGDGPGPNLILLEWCREHAVHFSHHKEAGQTLVLRIHAQDYDGPAAQRVDWEQIDHIVFVSPMYRQKFLDLHPDFELRSSLLRNHFDPAGLDLPKGQTSGTHLGLLGLYDHIKRPDLALDLLESLHRYDASFSLFYKGAYPWQREYVWRTPWKRERARHFYERLRRSELAEQIVFSPQDRETPVWFTDIGVILSTSQSESCHLAVAEGMASGAVPVIRGWEGADWQYPAKFVFPYEEAAFVDAATEFILSLRDADRRRRLSAEAREFARAHFDARLVCNQFDELFTRLAGR